MRKIVFGGWGPDKVAHFAMGGLFGFLACAIGWWALAVVAVVAIGKETYDYFHPLTHSCEVLDALMTVAGGVVVVGILEMIKGTP